MLHPAGSIPFAGTTTIDSGATDTGYTLADAISGSRSNMWRSTSTVIARIHTDLSSGVTSTCDYWYMARADLYYNNIKATTTGRFYLQSSPDDAAWTVRADNSITGQYGPRTEDTFALVSNSGAYRYWRVQLTTADGATTSKHTLSKVMFGTTYDIGRDPEYAIVHRRAIKRPGARDTAFTVECKWRGITDAKRATLISDVLKYKDVAPLVLYETTDNIFGGFKLLHVFITDCKITPVSQDQNDITMSFEECI
jgi:hypothetical protein